MDTQLKTSRAEKGFTNLYVIAPAVAFAALVTLGTVPRIVTQHDLNNIHEQLVSEIPSVQAIIAKQADSKNLESITDEMHLEALAKIFKDVTVLPGWGDFMKLLKKALSERSISAGDVKLRSFISLYLQKGWLVKEPVEGRSYGGYRYVSPTG